MVMPKPLNYMNGVADGVMASNLLLLKNMNSDSSVCNVTDGTLVGWWWQ